MSIWKKQINLTLLRNIFLKIAGKNVLISLFTLVILGLLGANLWFWLANQVQSPAPPEKIVSQNLAQSEKTPQENSGFGKVLATATKSATSKSQVLGSQIQGKITLALLGDSMVETLGDLKNLQLALGQYYSNVEFNLLNFGVGATKPTDGLARLTETTTTPTKQLPPLLFQKPDIVVVETFAYNHGKNTQEEINSHYETLLAIINKLKEENVTPLLLVTIAPSANFAKGAPNILWDENRQKLEAETVLNYLKAGLKFAQNQKLALVDAFNPSLASDGFAKQIYVNTSDNIHPSQEGIELVSDLIAKKIAQEKLVEKVLSVRD